jgi:3-isopropylmalate/(R)-2-methylmalate dehydratase small subunit
MSSLLRGRVWKFGDSIPTDHIAPGFALALPWEQRKKHILYVNKTFTEQVRPGDIIVAGSNFGCGSAREEAPTDLKQLGIGCVLAESFARIFFRNCISVGLPVLACKGVSSAFNEGDEIEVDFENAQVRNLTSGKELKGPPLAPDLLKIIQGKGILELLKSEKKGKV